MDAKTKEHDWTASMIEFLKTIDYRKSYSPDFLAKHGITTKDRMSGEDVIELVAAKIVEEDRINTPHLENYRSCLLYTSPSPRDGLLSRMPSSA